MKKDCFCAVGFGKKAAASKVRDQVIGEHLGKMKYFRDVLMQ